MRILGLISGTSVDAIDVALADITLDPTSGDLVLTPCGHAEVPWSAQLRTDLLATLPPARLDTREWCRLHTAAGRAFGEAARWALAEFGPADLVVSHGQTLHHLIEDGVVTGTLQVGDSAAIHAATGLPVLHDVRAADIAAGGQGAPLASTLDALWLCDEPTAALNLGGIANVTIVGTPSGPVTGDTGPANGLLEAAAAALGQTCDEGGSWAAAGRVDEGALRRLLTDPYYARPLPKSTGREHFHAGYVTDLLGDAAPTGPDLFATLTELTARTVADAIAAHGVTRLVVSGGGVENPVLLGRLRELTGLTPRRSDELGLPADGKEAYLMALLGWLSWHGLPGVALGPNGRVTGAREAVVLGSLTPPYHLTAHNSVPYPTRLVVADTQIGSRAAVPGRTAEATPDAPTRRATEATSGDRQVWSTERRLDTSRDIDTLTTADIVDVIVEADTAVVPAVRAVADRVGAAADLVVAALSAGGVVHYVGSGTSGRMGVLDAVELLPTFGVGSESVRAHLAGGLPAMTRAAEGAEDDAEAGAQVVAKAGPTDLVIGIAASGRTPYVRGALREARRRGLPTVLLSANPSAPLAEFADVAVLVDTGPEVVTGSTRMKAATAQKLVLNALSTAAMIRLGHSYGNLMIDMVATNAKLRDRSVRMLAQATGRPDDECALALRDGGDVRHALVALLAGLAPQEAGSARVAAAVEASPRDPARVGDPSGVRAAARAVRGAERDEQAGHAQAPAASANGPNGANPRSPR